MTVLRHSLKLQPLTERPSGLHEVNGGLEYVLKHKGKTYAVIYGENKIVEYKPWYTTEPLVDFWNKPPVFQSFMQAVMWLKKNVDVFM